VRCLVGEARPTLGVGAVARRPRRELRGARGVGRASEAAGARRRGVFKAPPAREAHWAAGPRLRLAARSGQTACTCTCTCTYAAATAAAEPAPAPPSPPSIATARAATTTASVSTTITANAATATAAHGVKTHEEALLSAFEGRRAKALCGAERRIDIAARKCRRLEEGALLLQAAEVTEPTALCVFVREPNNGICQRSKEPSDRPRQESITQKQGYATSEACFKVVLHVHRIIRPSLWSCKNIARAIESAAAVKLLKRCSLSLVTPCAPSNRWSPGIMSRPLAAVASPPVKTVPPSERFSRAPGSRPTAATASRHPSTVLNPVPAICILRSRVLWPGKLGDDGFVSAGSRIFRSRQPVEFLMRALLQSSRHMIGRDEGTLYGVDGRRLIGRERENPGSTEEKAEPAAISVVERAPTQNCGQQK